MIYLLITITVVFFLLNFQISKGDYLSPGPIFCLVFLVLQVLQRMQKSELRSPTPWW